MIIQSDNKAVEKTLLRLEKLLAGKGTWFHPKLTMVCKSNALSVQMSGPSTPGEIAIRMPPALLVPALAMNLSLKGEVFSIDPDRDLLTPIQIKIAELMVELYNETDKANFHRQESPWIRFREAPEFIESLLRARTINQNEQSMQQNFLHRRPNAISTEDFISTDFLMTRVIGIRGGPQNEKIQCVMPIIDYLNHDFRASSFMVPEKILPGTPPSRNDADFLRIQNSQPFVGKRDCYVSYGIYDALDTLLGYGFIDEEVPIIRSIPLKISIRKAGELSVNSYSTGWYANQVDRELTDIAAFMPAIERRTDGLVLSHLIIGLTTAPDLLRRTLHSLIRSMVGTSLTKKVIADRTYEAEKFILDSNIKFYKSLSREIDNNKNAPPHLKGQMHQIIDSQLNKLHKYSFNRNFFD